MRLRASPGAGRFFHPAGVDQARDQGFDSAGASDLELADDVLQAAQRQPARGIFVALLRRQADREHDDRVARMLGKDLVERDVVFEQRHVAIAHYIARGLEVGGGEDFCAAAVEVFGKCHCRMGAFLRAQRASAFTIALMRRPKSGSTQKLTLAPKGFCGRNSAEGCL